MPRKLSPDAERIALAIPKVAMTITGPMQLGRMWKNIILASPAPAALAANKWFFPKRQRLSPHHAGVLQQVTRPRTNMTFLRPRAR